MKHRVIAITNQKGGVGKTTTATNLACALAFEEKRVLVIDLDPQGNASQGLGVPLANVHYSVGEVVRNPELQPAQVICRGQGIDLIPGTPALARVEREMVGLTNSELRLARYLEKVKPGYDFVLIDTPPTFGPLLNSALNAADSLIVPVDPGFYALMGIKELLSEIEAIRQGTNPKLEVLGYLLTLVDRTKIATETWDELISSFGEEVFETRIRRSVKLKESPAFGKTVFQHASESAGAEDYMKLAREVITRSGKLTVGAPSLAIVGGAQ